MCLFAGVTTDVAIVIVTRLQSPATKVKPAITAKLPSGTSAAVGLADP